MGAGNIEAAESLMWMSEFEDVSDSTWAEIAAGLRGVDPDSMRLVAANLVVEGEASIRTLAQVYEARAVEGWRQVQVVSRAGRVFGLNVQRTDDSLVQRHAFLNAPIMVEQATLLLWGLSAWVVALWAAVRVVRARMPKRWLWAALSFVMVGRVNLNWTTGEGWIDLAAFFPPISWTKAGPMAPWVFGVGVPLFAMVAWRKAAAWERTPERPEGEPSSPGRWVVYRSVPGGGSHRLAAYATRVSAEQHANRLISAGLNIEYWVAEEEP